MFELFERNLAALEARRPQVFENLKSAIESFRRSPEGSSFEKYQFFIDSNKNINLLYMRQNPPCRDVIHSENPMDEITKVLTRAVLDYPQLILFFGQGLGHIPHYFFKNRPKTNAAMVLIEKDAQLFLRSLCVYDWKDIFEEDRFHLIISDDLGKIQNDLGKVLAIHTTVNRHLKIIPTPSALRTHPDFYKSVAELSLNVRDVTTLLVGNSVEDSFIGAKNILENIPMALKNPGIRDLKDKFKGKTIISVAAGPSADEHWDTLREVQGKIPIIACDVLLRPMLEKEIIPDIVCAIERIPLVATFFRNVPIPERTMLVGPLVLLKETFDAFEGTKLAYCPYVQNAKGIGLDFLGMFHPGSSAGNLNLALAEYMGFENIILVGHNLAFGFESRTSHIKGTGNIHQETPLTDEEIAQRSNGLKCLTQDGSAEVPTTRVWEMFRHQIENLISCSKDTRWINTAPKGALIKGAELLSLKEALNQTWKEDFDFLSKRSEALTYPSDEEVETRKSNIRNQLTQAKDRIQYWQSEAERIKKKLVEWRQKIEIKEKSGKRLSLEYLDKAIDEVLQVKVGAVNDDPVFNNAVISIISPAHTTFERQINLMPGSYKDNYLLKRDFLLEHQNYFNIWDIWIPRILKEVEISLSKLQES